MTRKPRVNPKAISTVPSPEASTARSLSHKVYLERLRSRWEGSGHRTALLQSIVYCRANDLPVPNWARDSLALKFADHLGNFDSETKRWLPESSGRLLGRLDRRGQDVRPSLDKLLGIQGSDGRRSEMHEWDSLSRHENDRQQIEQLIQANPKLTSKSAALELTQNRNRHLDKDADKDQIAKLAKRFYNAFKQQEYNRRRRKR